MVKPCGRQSAAVFYPFGHPTSYTYGGRENEAENGRHSINHLKLADLHIFAIGIRRGVSKGVEDARRLPGLQPLKRL
jgi:hypothetical protein